MVTRKNATDRRRLPASVKAITAIRNDGVILEMAVKYVCEDAFLKKIGKDIDNQLDVLQTHIRDLEKQLVGRPADDVDLSGRLAAIRDISGRLQKGEKITNDQCVKGALGKELRDQSRALRSELGELEGKVHGGNLAYSTSDSLRGVMGTLGYVFHPFVVHFRILMRVVAVLMVIAIGLFSYLAITMETEKDLLREIEAHKTRIVSFETSLSGLNEDLARVREAVVRSEQGELNRAGKARLMDLNVKAFKLSEKIEKTRADISLQQKAVADAKGRLDALKHKSFLERVLRR